MENPLDSPLFMNVKYLIKPTDTLIVLFVGIMGFAIGLTSSSKESEANEKIHPSASVKRRPSPWISKRFEENRGLPSTKTLPRLTELMARLLKEKRFKDWENELSKIEKYLSHDALSQEVLILFFSKWAEEDFQAALDRACKLSVHVAADIKKELFFQLTQRDPGAAMSYYESNKDVLLNHQELPYEIVRAWSLQDPEKAWEWCNVTSEKETRENLKTAFLLGLIEENDAHASEYMNKVSKEEGKIYDHLLTKWGEISIDSALEWFDSWDKKTDFYKGYILKGLLSHDSEIERATKLFLELPEPERIIHTFFGKSKIKNPESALKFIYAVKPQDKISESDLSALPRWIKQDAETAEKWVQHLPSTHPTKSIAVIAYSKGLSDYRKYDDALYMMNNVPEGEKKETSMKKILQTWQEKSPATFEKWEKTTTHARLIHQARTEGVIK